MSGREKDEGFKITDRRLFTSEGELRGEPAEAEPESKPEEAPTPPAQEPRVEPVSQTPPPPDPAPRRSHDPTPAADAGGAPKVDGFAQQAGDAQGVDFSSFLLSLATTAMVGLGEMPDPGTGLIAENLDSARQMIDILGVLKEKTQGNLDPEETRLLEGLLYELRMKFVSRQQGVVPPQPGPPTGA